MVIIKAKGNAISFVCQCDCACGNKVSQPNICDICEEFDHDPTKTAEEILEMEEGK